MIRVILPDETDFKNAIKEDRGVQIDAITVNAAGINAVGAPAVQGFRGNGDQAQAEGDMFGPVCRVTISKEGKALSRQQTTRGKDDAGNAQAAMEERRLLHREERAEQEKDIREGYREELAEIDKLIKEYNVSYAKQKREREDESLYDAKVMDATVQKRQDLREAIQDQKDFQTAEGQRLEREAQQMARQSAKYQNEIDENNRDLVTLLKTMEEGEKAEEEREHGGAEGSADSADVDASGTEGGLGGVIMGMASHFTASSVNRERAVENLMTDFTENGYWYLNKADSITRDILEKTADIRAAVDDENVTDEQIAEMMESFRDGMTDNYKNLENYRGWGLQFLRDAVDARIQRIANDPTRDMEKTVESMLMSAVDASMEEIRQRGLNFASQELEEQVQELIDERNNVDRIPEEEEKVEEEQLKETEEQEESRLLYEESLLPYEEGRLP